MPNWCNTNYRVIGEAKNVERLAHEMKELENLPGTGLVANGFGPAWLGNLVVKEGGDPNSVSCRGEWFFDHPEQPIVDGVLSFSVVSAWSEMSEWRHFLEKRFDVKVFFLSEEFGSLVFESNDSAHRFFEDEYYFNIDSTESSESDYYTSLDALVADVQKVTGTAGLSSYADCEQALTDYQSRNAGFKYFLIKLSYVD